MVLKRNIYVVIEHLEPCISPWLYLEYQHVSRIFNRDRVIFTNVKNEEDKLKLKSLGIVSSKRFYELFNEDEILILDPQASQPLRKEDLNHVNAVIIGGILGDNPPKGRTKKLITSKVKRAMSRNIGPHQYSIDGAAYVLSKIIKGKSLSEIKFIKNIEIKFKIKDIEYVVVLPFAYPLEGGKPVITPGLINFLKSKIMYYEDNLIKDIVKCNP